MKLDGRKRVRDGARTTVGALADAEPLRAMPAPFPAVLAVERMVSNQALVPFRGNRYSIPPGHTGEQVVVRHPLGAATLDILDGRGGLLAHHVRAADGAGVIVRAEEHVTALTRVVLGGPGRPRVARRPAGPHVQAVFLDPRRTIYYSAATRQLAAEAPAELIYGDLDRWIRGQAPRERQPGHSSPDDRYALPGIGHSASFRPPWPR